MLVAIKVPFTEFNVPVASLTVLEKGKVMATYKVAYHFLLWRSLIPFLVLWKFCSSVTLQGAIEKQFVWVHQSNLKSISSNPKCYMSANCQGVCCVKKHCFLF